MNYNECKTCLAGDGRCGVLLDDECDNCNKTRTSGDIWISANLLRSAEEIARTFAILDTTPIEYELFIDMDSTIVDFVKKAIEMAGFTPEEEGTDHKKMKAKFWKIISEKALNGEKFFAAMEPLPDAHILWEFVQKYPHRICTATGSKIHNPAHEKREYLIKHYGQGIADSAIFVRSAEDKCLYAAPNRILIDDRKKAIDPWIKAGGIGILHTSAASTIEQLKLLGLK